jgi:F0F1-type ATP synthase membrane subunit b/b'
MAMFLMTYLVLRALVIRPYLRLKDFREGLTSKRLKEAESLLQRAESLKASYEDSLSEARKKAELDREAILKEFELKAKEIETKTKEEVSRLLEARQDQIKQVLESFDTQVLEHKEILKQLFFEVLTGKRPKGMG